jgi:hypothetical protein
MGTPSIVKQSAASNGKTPQSKTSSSNPLSVSIPAMRIDTPYVKDGDPEGSPQVILQNDAYAKQTVANKYYDSLTNQAPNLINQSTNALKSAEDLLGKGVNMVNQASTEGDWWYDKSKDAYGKADNLLGSLTNNLEYTKEGNKWYDDYTRGMLGRSQNLLDTGQIPQPIMDAMLSAMTTGVNQSVGANVNDLASRGVLNSSVSNRALADASRSVSDSMNANYMDAFSTLLSGMNDTARAGAEGGKAFSDVNFNLNNSYQNALDSATSLGASYGSTGSQRVSDLLNVASGYNTGASGYGSLSSSWLNELSQNRSERESLLDSIPKYWANSLAPIGFTNEQFLTELQAWLGHKQDTVVSS